MKNLQVIPANMSSSANIINHELISKARAAAGYVHPDDRISKKEQNDQPQDKPQTQILKSKTANKSRPTAARKTTKRSNKYIASSLSNNHAGRSSTTRSFVMREGISNFPSDMPGSAFSSVLAKPKGNTMPHGVPHPNAHQVLGPFTKRCECGGVTGICGTATGAKKWRSHNGSTKHMKWDPIYAGLF
jgi:hypothetical protein